MWEGMQGPVNVAPYSTLGCLNSIETSDRKHAGKPLQYNRQLHTVMITTII